jgi:hypothetical protein
MDYSGSSDARVAQSGVPGEPGFGLLGWPIALGCGLIFSHARDLSQLRPQ